jgi:hypothetical protein
MLSLGRRFGPPFSGLSPWLSSLMAHYALNRLFVLIVPANFGAPQLLVEDIIYVFFCLVYVYVAFDMLLVFVPSLRKSSYHAPATAGVKMETHNEADSEL